MTEKVGLKDDEENDELNEYDFENYDEDSKFQKNPDFHLFCCIILLVSELIMRLATTTKIWTRSRCA